LQGLIPASPHQHLTPSQHFGSSLSPKRDCAMYWWLCRSPR